MLKTVDPNGPVPVESDEGIKAQVIEEIRSDARLKGAEIGVEVHGGNVVLRGHVGNDEVRNTALRTALSVIGVRDVRNQLEIVDASQPEPGPKPVKTVDVI